MYEIRNVWQRDPGLRKRCFTTEDGDSDLFVWEHLNSGKIVHFQFYFDKNRAEKMIEWKGAGFSFATVDDGGAFGFYKSSPILIRMDRMNLVEVLNVFRKIASTLDATIRDFIVSCIKEGLRKIS